MSDAKPVPSLSVVIPAHDEERRLGRTLEALAAHLRDRGSDWELLVVDDGSRDGTAELVGRFAGREPHARLLRHETNRGKGAAVRTGMLAARGDLVLFSDADLSTPIAELAKLEAAIAGGAAVALGSRALPESDVQVRQHPVRQRLGEGFNVLVRLLSGLPFADTQCGFKLVRREHLGTLFGEQLVPGFAFDVEMLMRARRAGLPAVDVPVAWVNSPDSRVSVWRDPPRMLWDLIRLRWRLAVR